MKKIILILIMILSITLLLNDTCEAQQMPENLEEAKEMGEKAVDFSLNDLPEIVEKSFQEEVLPIWKRMYEWFLVNIWAGVFKQEIEPRVREEYERRKPIVEEEFKKEKQEIREELPELWERFKELWHDNNNI